MKYTDLQETKGRHVCIFGDPNTGKSTLVSQLALKHKLLWISNDGGHTVIDKLPLYARENIEIVILPDTKEQPVAIQTGLKIVSGAEIFICDMHGVVSCSVCKKAGFSETRVCLNDHIGKDIITVFDNISQISDSCICFWINKLAADDKQKKIFKEDMDKDYYKMEWDDWRVLGSLMTKFLSNVMNARWDCVCIAHSIEAKNEAGQARLVPQVGTTNFSVLSGKYFDHVIFAEIANLKHKVGSSTTYRASVMTGSRTDIAIEGMGIASLEPFFDGTIPSPPTTQQAAAASVVSATALHTLSELAKLVQPAETVKQPSSAAAMLARLRSPKQ